MSRTWRLGLILGCSLGFWGCGLPGLLVDLVLAEHAEAGKYLLVERPDCLPMPGLEEYRPPVQPNAAPFSEPYLPLPPQGKALEEDYEGYLNKTYGGGNFDAWEAAADEAFFGGGYFPCCGSQAMLLLGALGKQAHYQETQQETLFLRKMDEWRRLFPDSRAQPIARAHVLIDCAWRKRGIGMADSVTEEGWKGFLDYLHQAQDAVLEALELGIEHPALYSALIEIRLGLGCEKEDLLAPLARGLELDPLYPRLYSMTSLAFAQKWGGSPSEWKEIAGLMKAVTWTRTGAAGLIYFYSGIARMGEDMFADVPKQFDWQDIILALKHYLQIFPENTYIINRVCLMACAYGDKPEAGRLFREIENNFNENAWSLDMFHAWRNWALEEGPKPQTTALHRAGEANDVTAARIALQQGDSLLMPNEYGYLPLYYAAVKDGYQVVRYLLEQGADPNTAKGNRPLIMRALLDKQIDIVQLLLEKGVDPNSGNKVTGWSLLHEAARAGQTEAVELLLNTHGIVVDPEDGKYWTPLCTAISRGHFEVVRLLVERGGADVRTNGPSGHPPIVIAVEHGQRDLVEYLLDHGATVHDVEPEKGWNAVVAAVDQDNREILELLLERGADVNIRQHDGWTAMHMAVLNGNEPLLLWLLEAGGDINVLTDGRRSLLHQAIRSNHPGIAKILIERGHALDVQDNRGRTPLAYAEEQNRYEIADLLRAAS